MHVKPEILQGDLYQQVSTAADFSVGAVPSFLLKGAYEVLKDAQ